MTTDGDPSQEGDTEATGIESLVARNRQRLAIGQARVNQALDRHRDRPMVEVSLLVYQRDREAAGTVVSSALAFRLFLFLVPVLVFAVGIAGFLGSVIDQRDLGDAGITGALAAQVDSALTQPNATRWLAVITGLVGIVFAGRTLSRVLVVASCLAWQLPVRPKPSARAVAAIIGLILGISAATVIVNQVREDHGLAFAGVSLAAAFAVYALAWLVMSLVLPRGTDDPGTVLPGTVLVAATLTGLQAFSTLVLPDRFARASQVYGTIGATIVTLGWLFIVSRVMVLSMAVNATIYERFGSVTRFVFSLPGFRGLASRWEWLRDFFDLET